MLEGRQLLSDVSAAAGMANAPVITVPAAIHTRVAAKTFVANSYFQGTATLDKLSGQLILNIKTVSGSNVTGSLYSVNWGGFTMPVTGTINSTRALTLAGKSATCQIKKFSAKLSDDSKTLAGTFSIIQMGMTESGSLTIARVSKAPVVKPITVPSLLGNYRGTISNGNKVNSSSIKFTRQQGALLWGTGTGGNAKDAALTGVVYVAGKFRLINHENGGYTIFLGQLNNDHSISGTWTWYGPDGTGGTFMLKKV